MAAGAAAMAAAIANAIKASGVLVRVEPEEFQKILKQTQKPLIVQSEGGFFTKKYKYLTSYKGFAFYAKSSSPIQLPLDAELVRSNSIWIPA